MIIIQEVRWILPFLNLLETMKNINSHISNAENNDDNDEDMLFVKSLVPQLKRLSNTSRALAKMQIQNLLFRLEFPNIQLDD